MSRTLHQQFSLPLLKWFRTSGRHDLPWQNPKTPYRVWISEVMLQQTQVKTVIPYFNRFITRFPDVFTLAQAPVDEVLAHWSGLGYYSRGRNLHQTAILLCEQFRGQLPQDVETLKKLPGIGPSTAAAIASLAYNKPTAILDGNVKRVLSRFFLIDGVPNTKEVNAILWEKAQACMLDSDCGDYTQAIMDLGATCCTLKKPNCALCPLQNQCKAYQKNLVSVYPFKKVKKSKPTVEEQFLLLYNAQNEVYLEKNPATGLWGGLWCLPRFAKNDSIYLPLSKCFAVQTESIQPIMTIKHTFSHFHLHINALSLKISQSTQNKNAENPGKWIKYDEIHQLGLPKPVSVILERHFSQAI